MVVIFIILSLLPYKYTYQSCMENIHFLVVAVQTFRIKETIIFICYSTKKERNTHLLFFLMFFLLVILTHTVYLAYILTYPHSHYLLVISKKYNSFQFFVVTFIYFFAVVFYSTFTHLFSLICSFPLWFSKSMLFYLFVYTSQNEMHINIK